MKYWVDELGRINKTFEPGSSVKNPGSLEFAAEHATREKDWTKKLAYLLRAIIVDHVFEDGNKRTAAYLIMYFFEENKITYTPDKIKNLVIKIASKNETDINKIGRMIQDETL